MRETDATPVRAAARRRPYETPRLRRHGDVRGHVLGGSPGPTESGGPENTRAF